MESVQQLLERLATGVIRQTIGADGAANVRPCGNPKFGDYQINGLLPIAKARGENPRPLADKVAAALAPALTDLAEPPTVAGAGFINVRLKAGFVGALLPQVLADPRLGVPAASPARTIVIDFSAPNVAKTMHVGHLRSSIIGDSIARTLRFLGHHVIADNHIGDWGTQFGFLLHGFKQEKLDLAASADPIAEMERVYRKYYGASVADPSIRDAAKAELVKLHENDAENLALWKKLRDLSMPAFEQVYRRLDVRFDHTLGESFYHPRLAGVVAELKAKGLAEDSEGAVCVFFQDVPQLKDKPFLIQKSDGAFLYPTTDLATLQYRVEEWKPGEIIYVTDSRQKLHFEQLFTTARRWSYADLKLAHVTFGSVLGEDNKPIKTRSGEPIKLEELLDEAERQAQAIVDANYADLPEATRREIARVVGIGAVKYADLSQNRVNDYVFSWPKMLAMQGNTAPYLQYAYVRIRSIFRKGAETAEGAGRWEMGDRRWECKSVTLADTAEFDLAKFILRFPEAIELATEDYRPNFICSYLYDLAGKFSVFYERCPVLKADEPARSSRLLLCQLTAEVLRKGLDLLGIQTIEQM
ncbi:MAG: arginine--tRNA ligase [Verrucomicrobia bacterium]|nr:arginine--tRNA ligase [Verrucomicrobiota bacterium]